MLLARRGYRVLLLDRVSFPSDTIRSHFIHHGGVAALQRWGLLEEVLDSDCPPIYWRISHLGDFPLRIAAESGDGVNFNLAPRRFVLDTILARAAVAAGAELRERFTVHELLFEDGRVIGVGGRQGGGAMIAERARIVVGADGLHSIVAKATAAPSYDEHPAQTFAYYSYFSDVPLDGIEVYVRPEERIHINFPTNHGLSCVAIQAPIGGFHAFRADIEGSFFRAIKEVPELAERVRVDRREERWYGTADLPGFFRKPYGPGWALVGDAGYHKDPITAQGITDAFRDAELLAEAIDAAFGGGERLGSALGGYERRRNEAAHEAYLKACLEASFLPIEPETFAGRAGLREAQSSPAGAL